MPNAGKSSLFNALTRAGAQAANYPFTTVEPNVAVVPVPDERLERGGRDHRGEPDGARDDRVPRHRRPGARRPPGRGPRQPVPGQHPRDRRDPARRARARRRRTWCTPRAASTRWPTSRRSRPSCCSPTSSRPSGGSSACPSRRKSLDKAAVAEERWLREVVEALRRGPRRAHACPRPTDAPGALVRPQPLTAKPVLYVANVAEGEPLEPPPELAEHAEAARRPRGRGQRAARRRAGRAGRRGGGSDARASSASRSPASRPSSARRSRCST